MRIKLSDHFNFKKLICFVIPSVCMMIFTSIYSVVDGFLFQIMQEKRRLLPRILFILF